MSIVSEIERIKANIANAYTVCEGKGATMPAILNSANLAECIGSITGETGGTVTYKDYIEGTTAIWTAEEEGLNVNNQWIDRINGYAFTPVSSSVVPVYDSEAKLLNFNAYGGMVSNFKPDNVDYTIEIVTRDIKNCSGETSNVGIIATTAYQSSGLEGFTFIQNSATTIGACQINDSSSQRYSHNKSSFADNSMDTFTVTPTEQVLNAEVVKSYSSTPEHSSNLALGCRQNTSNQRAKVKIHCVRYYPFKLTVEQLAHNRSVDIAIFGE